MAEFAPTEMESLSQLINPVDENENDHVYGSALTPAQASGQNKKEIAKPNVQVVAKTFNRDAHGGAPAEQIRAQEETKAAEEKKNDPKNVIWTPEEV